MRDNGVSKWTRLCDHRRTFERGPKRERDSQTIGNMTLSQHVTGLRILFLQGNLECLKEVLLGPLTSLPLGSILIPDLYELVMPW